MKTFKRSTDVKVEGPDRLDLDGRDKRLYSLMQIAVNTSGMSYANYPADQFRVGLVVIPRSDRGNGNVLRTRFPIRGDGVWGSVVRNRVRQGSAPR
jgi:hypothetical protein